MKVIIVDDEKIALEKLKEQLKQFEFVSEVIAFDNPFFAIDALQYDICDIAILDIEMFGINGIELAKQCKCLCPQIKIIFLTGYSEYALNAFKIHANGYLLKPVSSNELKEELLHAINRTPVSEQAQIRIQTFGNFEVFVNEKPVQFDRIKSKELLAYLISRKGAFVNGEELLAILYEDKPITPSSKSQLRNIIASLTKSLKAAGAEGLLIKRRNQLAVDTTFCQCDYYDFLKGNVDTVNSFMGEFMSNYEWAEFITGYLENKRG